MLAVLVLALAALADCQFAAPAAPARELFPPPPPSSFASFTPGFAPVAHHSPSIAVVQRSHQQDDRGQFRQSYSQTDGSSVEESGELRPTNDHRDNVIVKKGSYRYISPEGTPVEVHYTADEYGYRPQGSPLPQAPVQHLPAFR